MNKKLGNIKIVKQLENFFNKNAQKFNIETVFIFGSQAGGFPKEDSDIDIGIVFDKNKFSDEEIFFKITDISLKISEITGSDVNVIPVYNDFRKPLLYYNVIVLGRPLYIGNYDKYVSLKNEAVFQMEDFSIFGEKWMFEVAKNKLKDIINGQYINSHRQCP